MKFNDRTNKENEQNPFHSLEECTDGFLVVGYIKETHEKFAHFYAKDNACKDALTFFGHPVETWMDFTSGGEEEE